MRKDYTFHPKGHVPRNKVGDKPTCFPERTLREPRKGAERAKGVMGRCSGGFVQSAYTLPATAPVHRAKDSGKLYSSVYHRWLNGSSPKKKGSKGKATPETWTGYGIKATSDRPWLKEGPFEED